MADNADDFDGGFFRNLKGLATDSVKNARRRLNTPATRVDSGGTIDSHEFGGQDISRGELRDVKSMRESGGIIAHLVHAKALMEFGTGVEWHVDSQEDERTNDAGQTLDEWLNDTFNDIDTLALDIGEDAIWYPYGAAEVVETAGGGFSHIEPVEPWTLLPLTDDRGEIVGWEQEIQAEMGRDATQRFEADDIAHFVLNKASARDKTGISEVLRNEEEIEQFKNNQEAIRNATELAAYPHHHWEVGGENGAVIDDNELRRVRNMVDNMDGDTQFVTGSGVDHSLIEPGNFDFEAITEHDMALLTLAFGLPIEAGNFGSDGLGSGWPAKFRKQLLELEFSANQKTFTNQFVSQLIRPILRDYTPFDHTRNIEMEFGQPIVDQSQVVDMVQSVGDYMETNEAREKLDLPEREDLEDQYGPAAESGGDGGDGPLGGLVQEEVDQELDRRELQEGPFTDYPDAASENAQMALDAREETGDPNDCGTDVGWARANQLANNEPLSRDTVGRMAAFDRHRDSSEQSDDEGRADCGWMMWKAWGGDEGIEWAADKLDELEASDGGSGNVDQRNDLAAFEATIDDIYMGMVHGDETDRQLVEFAESELPDAIKSNLRTAVLSGSVFSDIETIPSGQLMDLRTLLAESLSEGGWTIDGLASEIQDLNDSLDFAEAERIARSETQSTVNEAYAVGLEERGVDMDEALFSWDNPMDNRTTEACEWLVDQTDPDHGGDPVTLDELKALIQEAPEHDDDVTTEARTWAPHINCRSRYVRHIE